MVLTWQMVLPNVLCLDVKVLDEFEQEIDLKQTFDDDQIPQRGQYSDESTADNSNYSDEDLENAGYSMSDGEDDDADLESDNSYNFDSEADDDFDSDDVDFASEEDDEFADDDDNEIGGYEGIDDFSDED